MAEYRIDYKNLEIIKLTNELVSKAQGGDIKAKGSLITLYEEYVEFMVHKYSKKTAIKDDDDLRSSIHLGFLEGIDRYDNTRNTQFIYFCHIWMKKMIFLDSNKNYNLIRLPSNQGNFKDQFISKYKGNELDNINDIDYEKFRVLSNTEVNLFSDFIVTNSDVDPIEHLAAVEFENNEAEKLEKLKFNINKLLKKFSEKERFIIEHLFGLNGKPLYSSKKIADELNVTKVNITFTKTRVIRLLRHRIFTDVLLDGV
ncbi:MAG: hypothetical protein KAH32_06740 [Chlamydiia bacterium]|nr:hypothetical protein [Chlamydiia bacterium]